MHENKSYKCVYDFRNPTQVQEIINKYQVGFFTRWKRFRGVGFEKKYLRSSEVIYDIAGYSTAKLISYGNDQLKTINSKSKVKRQFKTFYFSSIGLCVNLKNASKICHRANHPCHKLEDRILLTKSSNCESVPDIKFWGVINICSRSVEDIVIELDFPDKDTHNHSLDEF